MPGGMRLSLWLLAATVVMTIALTAFCFSQPGDVQREIPEDPGMSATP